MHRQLCECSREWGFTAQLAKGHNARASTKNPAKKPARKIQQGYQHVHSIYYHHHHPCSVSCTCGCCCSRCWCCRCCCCCCGGCGCGCGCACCCCCCCCCGCRCRCCCCGVLVAVAAAAAVAAGLICCGSNYRCFCCWRHLRCLCQSSLSLSGTFIRGPKIFPRFFLKSAPISANGSKHFLERSILLLHPIKEIARCKLLRRSGSSTLPETAPLTTIEHDTKHAGHGLVSVAWQESFNAHTARKPQLLETLNGLTSHTLLASGLLSWAHGLFIGSAQLGPKVLVKSDQFCGCELALHYVLWLLAWQNLKGRGQKSCDTSWDVVQLSIEQLQGCEPKEQIVMKESITVTQSQYPCYAGAFSGISLPTNKTILLG